MGNYFDQNITNEICKQSSFSKQFCPVSCDLSNKLIITPASLTEFLGKNITRDYLKSNPPLYSIKTSLSLERQISSANSYYMNAINIDIIKLLKTTLKEQYKYIGTDEGGYIYSKYDQYLDSKQSLPDIVSYTAGDRMCALPWEKVQYRDAHLDIIKVILLIVEKKPFFPFVRLICTFFQKLPSKNLKNDTFRKMLKKIASHVNFEKDSDLVDIEAIQFLLMGYRDKPVFFYTRDNLEGIIARICLCYSILKELKDKVLEKNSVTKEETKKILTHFQFIPGIIVTIDDLGNIKKYTSIEKTFTVCKKIIKQMEKNLTSS